MVTSQRAEFVVLAAVREDVRLFFFVEVHDGELLQRSSQVWTFRVHRTKFYCLWHFDELTVNF